MPDLKSSHISKNLFICKKNGVSYVTPYVINISANATRPQYRFISVPYVNYANALGTEYVDLGSKYGVITDSQSGEYGIVFDADRKSVWVNHIEYLLANIKADDDIKYQDLMERPFLTFRGYENEKYYIYITDDGKISIKASSSFELQ